jgi:uncharacterized membrane protein
MVTEDRVRTLEADMEGVWERLRALEGTSRQTVRAPAQVTPAPAPQPASAPAEPAPAPAASLPPLRTEPTARRAETRPQQAPPPPADPGRELEDLLGGRVLAWIGGFAVLVGLVFLVAVAISHGWIGEAERTVLAGLGSAALLGAGVRMHERHGRTDASLAMVAAGIAGLFGTVTVATSGYHLLPAVAGLALAFGVGSIATTLAVRWGSQGVGALGIVGCLLSPALLSAAYGASTVAFLFIAGASAVAVLLWQRWDWLALAVPSIAAVQWVPSLFEGASVAQAVATLAGFGVLGAIAALGYDIRAAGRALRPTSTAIFGGNALLLAGAGYLSLHDLSGPLAARVWLVTLAATHLLGAAATRRSTRVSDEMRMVVLGVGVLLADLALAATVRGPALAVTWAAAGLLFAAMRRRTGRASHEGELAVLGLGAHLALSLGQTLIHAAPPTALAGGADGLVGAMLALAALAGACFASGRLLDDGRAGLRVALDTCGLLVVAYQTAVALDGVALVVALAGQGAALAQLAHRTRDDLSAMAAFAFIAAAAAHAVCFEATPLALLEGADPLRPALLATLSIAVALLRAGRLRDDEWRGGLLVSGSAVLLYAVSVAVVTVMGGHEVAGGMAVEHAQQPQLALSALWALVGVVGLITGLRRDEPLARRGALALLLLTVAKVFLYDLAALDSVYRVGSCIGVGLLLLAGAHAYQRLRPRQVPDLRDAPDAIRDGLFAR